MPLGISITIITTSGHNETKICQSVFITFLFSGRIYTRNQPACTKLSAHLTVQRDPSGTVQYQKPSANLRAPRRKLAAFDTIALHILRAGTHFTLTEAGVISSDR